MATEFDDDQLESITGGDASFERDVLTEFLNSAPRDIGRIRSALRANDAAGVAASAHALKGASATIGAKGVAAIALEIENAGKRAALDVARDPVDRLEREFAELERTLRVRIGRAA